MTPSIALTNSSQTIVSPNANELKRYSYTGTHWFDNVTKEEIPVHNHDIGLAWEVSKLLV